MTDNEAFAAQDAIEYAVLSTLLLDAATPVLKQIVKDAQLIIDEREPRQTPPADCFMSRLQEFMKESA